MLHKKSDNQTNIIVKNGRFENDNITPNKTILEIKGSIDFSEIDFTSKQIDIIIINFATFADGRAFSLAKLLRTNGYEGILRAKGDILSDQYPLVIRCGFDEIEISQTHATRQPETQWSETFKQINNTYLDRLIS